MTDVMPTPRELRDISPSVQTLIAEAGGEGEEGMMKVAKVIHSRSMLPRWKGKSTDEIVQEPKQFSGWERKDRIPFLMQQPNEVYTQATRAMRRAREEMKGVPSADHFLTTRLYDSPERPSWAKKMRVVERYKGHIFLKE